MTNSCSYGFIVSTQHYKDCAKKGLKIAKEVIEFHCYICSCCIDNTDYCRWYYYEPDKRHYTVCIPCSELVNAYIQKLKKEIENEG